MGCGLDNISHIPLWKRWRQEFPAAGNLIYLNHAAVSPLCRRAAAAMRQLCDDAEQYGSLHYDTWMDAYEGLRVAAARMVNADRSEIALVKNTSEGIATVALGLDWRPGDKVVVFKEEFPANYYPWLKLQAKGVRIEQLSAGDSLDRIDEAATGARLLAISFVQYISGLRADLTAIGKICRSRGCFFFVDAIQGLGAFPVDVRESGIHALAADGHKWLTGPEGCGVLYVQQDVQDSVEPVEFGWTNVASYADYGNRDMTLRSDAGRYEPGTLNTVGCFGLRAAMEFLLEVGVERIGQAVLALGDRIAEGVEERGYELMARRTRENGSGIVSFRKGGVDSRSLYRNLKEQSILTAPRAGWLRTSPHFYISPDEIDRMLAALPVYSHPRTSLEL
jgi:selenocysteine lyase/cysteine desulfurase